MRRLAKAGRPAPPLDEPTTLLLLLGLDAPGIGAVARLQFTADVSRAAGLWRENESYVLREAARGRIAGQDDPDVGRPAFFGEYAVAMVERCPERWGG